MRPRWRSRQTDSGISRKMVASFCFVATVRKNKNEKCVCVCVYFMFIFFLFVSVICVTMQYTITCSAQNSILRLINISLPIALRVLLYLTFFEVGNCTNHVHYRSISTVCWRIQQRLEVGRRHSPLFIWWHMIFRRQFIYICSSTRESE
jgi:hypothetical protein